MKILNLQPYTFKSVFFKKTSSQNKKKNFAFNPMCNICIDNPKKAQQESEKRFFEEFLVKSGKVDKKEYEEIALKHPMTLSKCYGMCEVRDAINSPYDIAKFAVALKKYYDELYQNYTIISIGTSPAIITEVMQNIGCNVIFLPITNLRDYSENKLHPLRKNYPTIASRYPNVDTLMKYATKKGIAKKNSGDLVVLDYTVSGKSLDTMVKILEERNDIDPDRINDHSIVDDINEIINGNNPLNLTSWNAKNLEHDLRHSYFEDFINVAHFTFDDSSYYGKNYSIKNKKNSEIFKEFDSFSQKYARAWALCSTHEAFKILNNIS